MWEGVPEEARKKRRYARNTHIKDPLVQQLSPPQSPVERLDAAVASEEVHRADVRVLGEVIVTFGDNGECGGVAEFVKDELQDLIYCIQRESRTESALDCRR